MLTFTVDLVSKKFAVHKIYVVKDLYQPPLGSPLLEALDLIKKNCVQSTVKRKPIQSTNKGIVSCSKA